MKYLLLFLSVTLLGSCKVELGELNAQEGVGVTSIPNVKVKKLELSNDPIPISTIGVMEARRIVDLSFKVGGIVSDILVSESQRVRKGDLLANIISTEIDAEVLLAQQSVDKAQLDLERIENMFADTAATKSEVENITSKLNTAMANLEVSKFNQKYSRIVSPVNGRVLKRFAENGEHVQPGSSILKISSIGSNGLILKSSVADKDVVKIVVGDKAEVVFDVYPKNVFTAYISGISEFADGKIGTYDIELTINSIKGLHLKSGFVGSVRILPKNRVPYYKIDLNALVEGDKEKANIFIARHNDEKYIARKLEVVPDYISSDFFIATSTEFENGMKVIVEGGSMLKSEVEVNILNL